MDNSKEKVEAQNENEETSKNIDTTDTVETKLEEAAVNKTTEKTEKVENNPSKVVKKYKAMIAVMAVIIVGMAVFAGYLVYNNNSTKVDDSSIIATIASNKEKKEYTEKIAQAMGGVREQNSFVAVQDGEDTGVVIVYNKKGEAFAQSSDSSYITIYRDDHKAVRFTEYVDFGYDSDVISLLENVSKMTELDRTIVLKDKLPNKDGFTSYIVDVRTWDGVLELYSMFDAEFGQTMVDQLKHSLETEGAESGPEPEQINFRMIYILDEEGKLAAAECYVYFGEKASDEVTMEELGLSWKFDGIQSISDWELDSGWYKEDWETLSEWTDISMAEELLTKQYGIISAVVQEYFPEMTEGEDGTTPETDGTTDTTGTGDATTPETEIPSVSDSDENTSIDGTSETVAPDTNVDSQTSSAPDTATEDTAAGAAGADRNVGIETGTITNTESASE